MNGSLVRVNELYSVNLRSLDLLASSLLLILLFKDDDDDDDDDDESMLCPLAPDESGGIDDLDAQRADVDNIICLYCLFPL